MYESHPLDLEAVKERAEYAWENRNSGLREQTLAKSGRDVPTLLAALEKAEHTIQDARAAANAECSRGLRSHAMDQRYFEGWRSGASTILRHLTKEKP